MKFVHGNRFLVPTRRKHKIQRHRHCCKSVHEYVVITTLKIAIAIGVAMVCIRSAFTNVEFGRSFSHTSVLAVIYFCVWVAQRKVQGCRTEYSESRLCFLHDLRDFLRNLQAMRLFVVQSNDEISENLALMKREVENVLISVDWVPH